MGPAKAPILMVSIHIETLRAGPSHRHTIISAKFPLLLREKRKPRPNYFLLLTNAVLS